MISPIRSDEKTIDTEAERIIESVMKSCTLSQCPREHKVRATNSLKLTSMPEIWLQL